MNLNIPLAKNLNNETPLIFEKDEEGYKIIKSKLTNLSIRTTSEGLSKMDIYFSQNMIEMINLVHFSLVTHIPLIFEAELTQGKKTSIKYVIESLGLKYMHSPFLFFTLFSNIYKKITPNFEKR